MKTPTPILFLLLSTLAGCSSSHVMPDGGAPPSDAATSCALDVDTACAAWDERATSLGCMGTMGTWPCPWAAPLEIACLDTITGAATCTDLGLIPNRCPVCR